MFFVMLLNEPFNAVAPQRSALYEIWTFLMDYFISLSFLQPDHKPLEFNTAFYGLKSNLFFCLNAVCLTGAVIELFPFGSHFMID